MPLRLTAVAWLCVALALPAVAAAQSAEEVAFARAHLEALQERSFRNGREYCGFFGRDKTGKMVAVKARPGTEDECTAYWPHPRISVFASYHTHGIWDGVSDSEVPSVQDVEGDMADGIDGYLSTPGGRFWFIDGETGVSRKLCGERCLLTDHRYDSEVEGVVPEVITLEELKERQSD
jgi:hypothetical protein